jgi:chemotaxis protein methyltransferase CheR
MADRDRLVMPADAFADAKRLIVERTGHFYYVDKDYPLRERLARRMRARKLTDLADYLALLASEGPDQEWSALESEITIGETFFFRFAEHFAALRERILPSIIESNAGERRIRVWSAGCSTGAEAYSVAIVLQELLGTALPDWRVTIMGTDISARAICQAQAAQFGAWALRGMPPADRDRYFVEAGKGAWRLKRVYQSLTRFQQHNLMSLFSGPPPVQFTELDLILCRNVLIYFHPDTAQQIGRLLTTCLRDGGWLLFGHAEAGLIENGALTRVSHADASVYCKGPGGEAPFAANEAGPAGRAAFEMYAAPNISAPEPWAPLPPPAPSVVAQPSPPLAPEPAIGVAASQSQAAERDGRIQTMRSLADRGDVEGALKLCLDLLAADPMSAQLHFRAGVLQQAAGAHARAAESLRRAIYLDKGHVLAHLYLGLSLVDLGDATAGRRAIATAAYRAAELPEGAPVEDGDGLNAADVHAMARHCLASVTAALP